MITPTVNPRTRRLFVGLRLDPSTIHVMTSVAERLFENGLRGRYVDSNDFHVTLAFLGNVAETQLGDVIDVLEKQAARVKPFEVRFDRLGAFPNKRRPRVVWVGCSRFHRKFQDLGTALRDAYAELGFMFRDDLRIHVALCRPKPQARLRAFAIDPIVMPVTTVNLFESTQALPRYRSIHEVALGSAVISTVQSILPESGS